MVVALEDPKQPETSGPSIISIPSNASSHPISDQDAQTLGSELNEGDIDRSHTEGRFDMTHPQYDEYTALLKKHLSVVEGELSKMKGLQTVESGAANKNGTAQPSEMSEKEMQAQEAKIQRVAPWEWRAVKKERGIKLELPALIVSSKGYGRPGRRLAGRRSMRNPANSGSGNSNPGEDSSYDIAYLLAINSRILLNLLGDCTGTEFPEDRNVWLRPFKYLVAYETEIRNALQDAEVSSDLLETASGPSDRADTIRNHNDVSVPGTELMQEREEVGADAAKAALGTNRAMELFRAKAERDHLRCLVNFMDTDMQDIFDVKRQVANQTLKEVTFEHLWLLYRPGDLVYSMKPPEEVATYRAYRVLHVTGGRPILDTANESDFDPIDDRSWEESETEEKACDNILGSPSDVTPFIIDCFSIDFDGNRLGPRSIRFVIPKYNGKRKIDALDICPSFHHPKHGGVYSAMVERGRRVTQLANKTHRQYSGRTLRESRELWRVQWMRMGFLNYVLHDEQVHSEVMLDQAAAVTHYRKAIGTWRLKLNGGVISAPTLADPREIFDPVPLKRDGGLAVSSSLASRRDKSLLSDVFDDDIIDTDRRNEFINSTTLLRYRNVDEPSLSDDYVMLLPFRVYGYAMLNRKWFPLNINLVNDITPDQLRTTAAGYEDLVLPEGHKKLLQAIVKNQVRDPRQTSGEREDEADEFQMDVVKGKGKGLIILLHGAPGVGKTSTAECVAAQLKRPLLPITCGDISTEVKTAEETLQEYCALAYRWRCVLLLDEADVFLATRTKGDIRRNGLVSVFLRVLEYFSGVIILTTNRVGEFDEAFRSRIHVSLYYPKLDQAATLQIWDRNLLRLRKSGLRLDFSEDEIRKFAEQHWLDNVDKESRHWNGRQIKNAFQTALALANWEFFETKQGQNLERPLLKAKHFDRVAKTSAHFDDYISDIYGISEDTFGVLAGRSNLRKDTHPAMSLGQSRTRDFVPRSERSTPARRRAGARNARPDESRKMDSGSDELAKLELQYKIMQLKQAKDKEQVQAQAGDDDDEDDW